MALGRIRVEAGEAERGEQRVIEGHGAREIIGPEGGVAEHGGVSGCRDGLPWRRLMRLAGLRGVTVS